ncbi:MAG TPA: PfkB family carbohydrate kinase [Thermoplasmata archaeon]|nr:PfkB family carbohydrate kinase [Thermoplasmata archaeon]
MRVPTSQRPGDLLVAGHTVIDRYLDVRRLPQRDRTVPVRGIREVLGGTAANIARAAAGRGLRTALVSRVGPDFPPPFREELRQSHLVLDGFVSVPGQRSPSCVIVEDGRGGQMTLIDQGAMDATADAAIPLGLLRKYPWIHLTTGDPEYQLRLLRAARAEGARVAADPAQEIHYRWNARGLRRLLAGSEIFFGNEAEVRAAARTLTGGNAKRLTSLVPLVVVTRGRRGARAYSRRGIVDVPGKKPKRLRQVTGAGDSFRGGFYAAFLRGAPLASALEEGVDDAVRWIETAEFPRRRGR